MILITRNILNRNIIIVSSPEQFIITTNVEDTMYIGTARYRVYIKAKELRARTLAHLRLCTLND